MVAGSVRRRFAMARTLSNTYSRGCSRIGRIISCRLTLSCSMRSPKCIEDEGDGPLLRFITREDCLNHPLCQPVALRGQGFAAESLSGYFLVATALISSPGATTGWRNGIMARSLGPSCSTGCCCSRWREQQHPVEQLGPKLRAMMPFLQPVVAPGLEIKAVATKK